MNPSCVVCHGRTFELRCNAAELAAQQAELERFHRARLARRRRGELDERARFTQDYVTELVTCATCGLLMRSPRPRATDVERAYERGRLPAGADRRDPRGAEGHLRREARAAREPRPRAAHPRGRELRGRVPRRSRARRAATPWASIPATSSRNPAQNAGFPCWRALSRSSARGSASIPTTRSRSGTRSTSCPIRAPPCASSSRCLKPDGVLAIRVPHGLAFEKLLRRYRSGRRPAGTPRSSTWRGTTCSRSLTSSGTGSATLDRLVGAVRVRARPRRGRRPLPSRRPRHGRLGAGRGARGEGAPAARDRAADPRGRHPAAGRAVAATSTTGYRA